MEVKPKVQSKTVSSQEWNVHLGKNVYIVAKNARLEEVKSLLLWLLENDFVSTDDDEEAEKNGDDDDDDDDGLEDVSHYVG